jgi:manganese/zinc/iron transport system permease protein
LMGADFVTLSLVPILVAVLAAVACALPGNFLILRRQAMMGDMMAHSVLPGIVAGFLITGGTGAAAMFAGALAAALLAAAAVEGLRRFAQIDAAAAMGLVFTTLFAAGVLMIEQTGTGRIHLDVEHALYGNLESLIWLDASGWGSLADPGALAGLPAELPRMAVAAGLIAVLGWIFWRPLVLCSFDADHARVLGLPAGLVSLGLAVATAVASVAAFAAVGSILTIAMLICPPAAARLMTDRLPAQVGLSVVLAAVSAATGYVLAGYGPIWLGLPGSVSAAGMIAVVAGAILAGAAIFGPHRRRAGA